MSPAFNRAARLKTVALRNYPPRLLLLHNIPRAWYSIEASPVARQAHFDKENGLHGIAEITARRAKAGKLVAGVAAASDSDMFKGPVSAISPETVLHRKVLYA